MAIRGASDNRLDSPEAVARHESVCDAFEAAWASGNRPDLGEYLARVEESVRESLLRDLLELELEYRADLGETPEPGDYHSRFGDCRAAIEAAFASFRRSSPGADAETLLREINPARRYRDGEEVARGGMGAIRLAEEIALHRRIAVKTMLEPLQKSPENLARFIEEAQITGQLEHPGIVPVHEIGTNEDGQVYYAMQYVRGRDLAAVLAGIRDGDAAVIEAFPLQRLLAILNRVCDAVAFAHSRGVIHRDLKPANIRIGNFGEVYVMDWGLACLRCGTNREIAAEDAEIEPVETVRARDESGTWHTLAGGVMGSPQYMSPEQAAGDTETLDERADIYALGAILYQVLTLEPPVDGKDVDAVLDQVAAGGIPSPAHLNRDSAVERERRLPHCPGRRIPVALAAVATKALAHKAGDRYASAQELQREVEAWQGGFATEAEDPGLLRHFRLFVRRHRIAAAAAAVIAVLLVVASAVNLHERNIAVQALADYERSEAEKREQARLSAPAYLEAALALEQTGAFAKALVAAEHTLERDIEFAEAHRVRSFLLARADRFEEAGHSAESVLALLPDEADAHELKSELARLAANKAEGGYARLAGLATRAGMASTATDLLARSKAAFEEKYAAGMPIWRRKLNDAWPGVGDRLTVHSEYGLALHITSDDLGVVHDLEPLRGIPLGWLSINVNIDDLSPLAGIPLQKLQLFKAPVETLAPLEGMPLRHFHLNFPPSGYGDFSPDSITKTLLTDLSAFRGMNFEFLKFRFCKNLRDFSPLRETQIRELHLTNTNPNSFAFLRRQKSLRIIGLEHNSWPADGDFSPLFECATLEEFCGHWWVVGQSLGPAFGLILDDNLEGALELLREMKGQIRSRALDRHVAVIDALAFLVAVRLGHRVDAPSANPAIRHAGAKAYVLMPYRGTSPAWYLSLCEALALDPASITNREENEAAVALLNDFGHGDALIGGALSGDGGEWRWLDGSPWEFDRFPPEERNAAFEEDGKMRLCLVLPTGTWKAATSWERPAYNFLLQIPADLLSEER